MLANEKNTTTVFSMKKVLIYTDGSSRGNPGPGGYGIVLLSGERKRELSGGFSRTTNNRMELMAVIAGLEALNRVCQVEVYSDSTYVINAMNKGWSLGWKAHGWAKKDKNPLKNADLWKRLYLASQKHEVSWIWVKGHAGNVYNECCDVLATSAAQQEDLPADEYYLTSEAGDSDLFSET